MKKLLFLLLTELLLAIPLLTRGVASADVIHLGCGASLQAAYDALPFSEGGVLELDDCRYDVDSGLRLDRRKPVAIIGPERARRHMAATDVDDPTKSPGAVIYCRAVRPARATSLTPRSRWGPASTATALSSAT